MGVGRVNETGERLREAYVRLRRAYGHARWWPARTSFEVCVGAILTQNTSWSNVEKALHHVRAAGLLSFRKMSALTPARLASLVRASGTYKVKGRRLAAFLRFLGTEYGGRVSRMSREKPSDLRAKLLTVNGIGPETADSVVLYAAGLPMFVVDAYTRRAFTRLGLLRGTETYDEIQRFFMERLPRDAALFNDYHAQIVRLAKETCRTRPLCARCPLEDLCPRAGVAEPRS